MDDRIEESHTSPVINLIYKIVDIGVADKIDAIIEASYTSSVI